jgi:type I restriction enzyme M protein
LKADSDNLPPPAVIEREIIDDLEAALAQFRLIRADLGEATEEPSLLKHSSDDPRGD